LRPGEAKFVLLLPPTPELIAALHLGAHVETVKELAGAHYWPCGR
jgi:hypothetical protein